MQLGLGLAAGPGLAVRAEAHPEPGAVGVAGAAAQGDALILG